VAPSEGVISTETGGRLWSIDRLAVGASGPWVIDAKYYACWVEQRDVGRRLGTGLRLPLGTRRTRPGFDKYS
jgi:hypothetical protein